MATYKIFDGFDYQSLGTSADGWSKSGSITIETASPITGSASLKVPITASIGMTATRAFEVSGSPQSQVVASFTMRIDGAANGKNTIAILQGSALQRMLRLKLNTDNTLEFSTEDGVIGTSSALTTGTVYWVDMKLDRSAAAGSHIVEARLNGTAFATKTDADISVGVYGMSFGGNILETTCTSMTVCFDDMVIESTGTYPTYRPYVITKYVSAAGDNAAWTPSAGSNYQCVDEQPYADNLTTYVSSNTLNQIDDYAVENPSLTDKTIRSVLVNTVYSGTVTGGDHASFVVRLKAVASGTVLESSARTPLNGSWLCNNRLAPYSPLILTNTSPETGVAWTESELDSMQIGVKLSASSVDAVRISQITAVIYYDEDPGTTTSIKDIIGGGFIIFPR